MLETLESKRETLRIEREHIRETYGRNSREYYKVSKQISILNQKIRGEKHNPEGFKAGRTRENLVGQRFGSWTVLERTTHPNTNRTAWICRCDCGKVATVLHYNLKSGMSTTCGCSKNRNGLNKPDALRKQRRRNIMRRLHQLMQN